MISLQQSYKSSITKSMNIFTWLSKLPSKNLTIIVKVGKTQFVYTAQTQKEIKKLSVKEGEFAMALVIEQTDTELIESGIIHYDNDWEVAHPLFLSQINKLTSRKITFANILDIFPSCPAKIKVVHDIDETETEEIAEEVLNLTWVAKAGKEASATNITDPVDRMLEWLELQPAENLQATVQLGTASMEFCYNTWNQLSGFGRCADDRWNGEITIVQTSANGHITIAGLLLSGEWHTLAPEGVKKDHGHKYPENAKYVSVTEMFPNCPLSRS